MTLYITPLMTTKKNYGFYNAPIQKEQILIADGLIKESENLIHSRPHFVRIAVGRLIKDIQENGYSTLLDNEDN